MPWEKELITAHALAAALNLAVDTVWRYTREKKIPYIELGNRQYRYNLDEVVKALSQPEVKETGSAYGNRKKYTYQDYLALPEEEGWRHEILDGELVKEPSPSLAHQQAVGELFFVLKKYFAEKDPEGYVFPAPLDITFHDTTVVQPDILYVAGTQKEIMEAARINGPPMLVVEILSPATRRKDRVKKMQIYQHENVRHYWLVDPVAKTLECFALRGGLYALVASGMDTETVKHPDFDGLAIDLGALWLTP